jgi:hypothetical protein
VSAAYFPSAFSRLIDATADVAKAAREACLRSIVNMSQISDRREWESHQARGDWISERVFSFRNAVRMPQRIDAARLSSFRQLPSRRSDSACSLGRRSNNCLA